MTTTFMSTVREGDPQGGSQRAKIFLVHGEEGVGRRCYLGATTGGLALLGDTVRIEVGRPDDPPLHPIPGQQNMCVHFRGRNMVMMLSSEHSFEMTVCKQPIMDESSTWTYGSRYQNIVLDDHGLTQVHLGYGSYAGRPQGVGHILCRVGPPAPAPAPAPAPSESSPLTVEEPRESSKSYCSVS